MKRKLTALACIAGMTVLILDAKTAASAVYESIELCIRTVIPSLFPFFVLSAIFTSTLSQYRIPPLARLLGIPQGWESVFLLGCVGGYPVGAQCIAQGYSSGELSRQDAQRILPFCTNCGPSFLFGIVGACFNSAAAPAAVMLIGVLSALLTGTMTAVSADSCQNRRPSHPLRLTQAVSQAMRSMASVCAWVILARTVVCFLQRWFLWLFSEELQVLLIGGMELTQGCLLLPRCDNESVRFIVACVLTSFGGLCVSLQVSALCAAAGLSSGRYLPLKLLQALLAALLAAVYTQIPGNSVLRLLVLTVICIFGCILIKKGVEIPRKLMYNSSSKGGI